MRIGIVCPYNYYRPGGVQVCVREIANELIKRGHYVKIIAPKPRKVPKNIDKDVILLGGSTELVTPFATKADISINLSNDKIDELLEKERFDVLHFHEPGIPVWSMQILGRSSAANVGTIHATLPDGMVSKSFEKIMKPAAKFIETRLHVCTTVSKVSKNTALTYSPNADIEIIPNGINLELYKAKVGFNKPINDPKVILYVGRLEKRKGVKYLIKAYAKLKLIHDNIKLVIAGDGNLRESLENYIEKNNIKDVEFLGFVSEKEKIRLMQTCDLYCSPALYGESFGIVLLEAMAAGSMVVCGDNPGYSSVMLDTGKISLVDPKATEEFTRRLELLLFDNSIRKVWLDWATNYVMQFDYKKVVNKYEKAYLKAIDNKGKNERMIHNK